MASIIRLNLDRHREVQTLLPWYVTDQLDAADRARVEAHLADCAECRAELSLERHLDAGVAGLPLGVEQDWAEFRRRLRAASTGRSRAATAVARLWRRLGRRASLGWVLAAQMAAVLVVGALLLPFGRPAPYRALGTVAPAPVGNVMVIFRPDASERDLRQILRASGARLVGGPTAADAYVLIVPAAERPTALTRLRGDADVVLAEPIDPGEAQ
jgi:anti-sigma factor RsiW